MHFRESNFQKFYGGACPRTPLEARAFGPSIYRAARLLYNENPPTSKLNETPEQGEQGVTRGNRGEQGITKGKQRGEHCYPLFPLATPCSLLFLLVTPC